MARKPCRAELDLYGETYRCDRKRGHDGKHRERMYGADGAGQYVAAVQWRRIHDRRV